MRKKLDTRFPASRIKKIMQADEDVGKIAMAVPLLVSKALELFLQDLCDRTYEITLQRGAKTMNSLHLKQCVQSFNVFDFLREIVSKVPDMGGFDAAAGEDKSITRRRKAVDGEDIDTDEESKRSRINLAGHSGSVRGRGRRRGRGRGRPSRVAERESTHYGKCEDDPDISPQHNSKRNANSERLDNSVEAKESKENIVNSSDNAMVRNFDLNIDLCENVDTSAAPASIPKQEKRPEPELEPEPEIKHEEYPGWSLSDMHKMAIDPIQLAQLNGRMDEEEDYDEEE